MKRDCLANTLKSYIHLIVIEHEVKLKAEPIENILYKIKGHDMKNGFHFFMPLTISKLSVSLLPCTTCAKTEEM